MISKGTASVKVRLSGQDREKRLASFSPGAVFGEVALLDEEPRSATVTADEELVCYMRDDERFRALTGEHPAIAFKLLANLSRELTRRLRKANATISQPEGRSGRGGGDGLPARLTAAARRRRWCLSGWC